jgi:hypothetical protein
MEVLRYDKRLMVWVRISDLSGGVVRYCVVRFDNALGKVELNCVDDEKPGLENMPRSILRRPSALSYRITNNAGTPQPHQRPSKT